MDISVAGLIGAAIGLYIGWLDYGILNGLLSAMVERTSARAADGPCGSSQSCANWFSSFRSPSFR
ncbi:hypothetical protein V6L77_25465 [Pannonibacter sp. Pt2-lr]